MDLAIITYIPEARKRPESRVITKSELQSNDYSTTQDGFFKYLMLFIRQGATIMNVEYSPDFHNLSEYPNFP